jgi:hypothetical protein
MIGRVEWAWLAAPLIALVGAFSVIRYAQLDIGFARSVTEIAVAELHAAYPRAHVTRYTALYSSLSTGYDVEFEDPDALVQPFGTLVDDQRWQSDRIISATLRSDRNVTLSGFQVASNKTGFVHCEQYCDLGGSMQLLGESRGARQVENKTAYSLHDVGVLWRSPEGRLEGAWVGDLAAGAVVPLEFVHLANGVVHLEQWDKSATTMSLEIQLQQAIRRLNQDDDDRSLTVAEAIEDPQLRIDFVRYDENGDGKLDYVELIRWARKLRAGEISMGQMVGLATRNLKLQPGDVRLIGWSDEPMPDRSIIPSASQVMVRTMFLVHLEVPPLPVPAPDLNCLADVDDRVTQPVVNEDGLEGQLPP